MTWIESTDHLPPVELERLLNALTVGLGHIAFAQRRIEQNGSTLDIAHSLVQAHLSLRVVQVTLAPDGGKHPDPSVLLHLHDHWNPPARWADFLAGLAPIAAQRLLTALQEVVHAARVVRETVLTNADRRVAQDQIAVTVSALERVRQHLKGASEPRP